MRTILFLSIFTLAAAQGCIYRALTQGDWGEECTVEAEAALKPGCYYRDQFFSTCFPSALEVGCPGDGFSLRFTSAVAIRNFLPQDPSARSAEVLTRDWVDSTTSDAGQAGGELVALAMTLGIDGCQADFASCPGLFRDIHVCDNRIPINPDETKRHAPGQFQGCFPFYGWTVAEIFNEAQRVVGGCSNGSYSIGQINDCLALINQEFAGGRGFQGGDLFSGSVCPVLVPITVAFIPEATALPTSEVTMPLPETSFSLPDTSFSLPDTSFSLPDTSVSLPDTAVVIPAESLETFQQDVQTTAHECSASALSVGLLFLIVPLVV